MGETILSEKGQMVIPKDVRDGMSLKKGQKLIVEEWDGVLIVIPVPKDPAKSLKGIAKGLFKGSSVELVRELRKEWQ